MNLSTANSRPAGGSYLFGSSFHLADSRTDSLPSMRRTIKPAVCGVASMSFMPFSGPRIKAADRQTVGAQAVGADDRHAHPTRERNAGFRVDMVRVADAGDRGVLPEVAGRGGGRAREQDILPRRLPDIRRSDADAPARSFGRRIAEADVSARLDHHPCDARGGGWRPWPRPPRSLWRCRPDRSSCPA